MRNGRCEAKGCGVRVASATGWRARATRGCAGTTPHAPLHARRRHALARTGAPRACTHVYKYRPHEAQDCDRARPAAIGQPRSAGSNFFQISIPLMRRPLAGNQAGKPGWPVRRERAANRTANRTRMRNEPNSEPAQPSRRTFPCCHACAYARGIMFSASARAPAPYQHTPVRKPPQGALVARWERAISGRARAVVRRSIRPYAQSCLARKPSTPWSMLGFDRARHRCTDAHMRTCTVARERQRLRDSSSTATCVWSVAYSTVCLVGLCE